MSVVRVLPELRAGGGTQMVLDDGLLAAADEILARRYSWAPPALSLGKFQQVALTAGLPFDVVRRPSGGRAVLHGEEFEWSFAVVFPAGALPAGPRAHVDITTPYELVAQAFAAALEQAGVTLDGRGETPYQRSALCFAGALRHDLCFRGEKIVAIAQAKRDGRALVHGSVLMRRPPDVLTQAVEKLVGETWQGEGLAGGGIVLAPETIWNAALMRLEAALRSAAAG